MGAFVRPSDSLAQHRVPQTRIHDPGRYALPQDSELHREGGTSRCAPRVHRTREHQPGQSDRRQETAEQDHRVPRNAAEMARSRRHYLRRIYSRLPCRHEGIDRPRYRDHQAGITARYPRVLFPDASARLRRSQGAFAERHLDGSGHEQIRP